MAGRHPYPQEMKERAVRMVAEVGENYGNEYAAIKAVAARLGIGSPETVRKWLRRAQVDAGERPGLTSEERAEIKALKQEVAELRRANEILKAASAFFAAQLGPPPRCSWCSSASTRTPSGSSPAAACCPGAAGP